MFLAIIGTLGLCYGTIKKDVKTVVASCAANTAGYYLADTTQKKFLKRTKEARRFWDDLVRDQEERNRIHTEYQRWYKPSHQM